MFVARFSGTVCECLAPPRISGVIEKRLFISGNSASLKCNTTKGTEPVTFKWFLNDSLVTVSPNIDMKSDELRVANVSTYLSGTYRCLASNAYGEDEAFLNVNVVGEFCLGRRHDTHKLITATLCNRAKDVARGTKVNQFFIQICIR